MSDLHTRLARNLSSVQERIAAACGRSGRDASELRLVAVTKYAEWEWVRALVELGETRLGESRPQQLVERAQLLRAEDVDVEWHLIGHLQRNKVRPVLPVAAVIHSVDSLRLLQRIDQIAAEVALSPRVLLEVNVSGEASKDGFAPETLRREWETARQLVNVCVEGLMTMAPAADDPETPRKTFRALRELRDELESREGTALPELSMGMSGDFEVAIEEGATLIRLGSVLFEGLQPGSNRGG